MSKAEFLRNMLGAAVAGAVALAGGSGGAQAAGSAHDFAFTDIDGQPMPLSQFKGKAMLIVNTASQCGFTPQYKALQALWTEYRDRGLVVIGVPSNDFG
ncbi:MAG TPA: redoxin domain-containing protein, partial [Alphaproteobacteria bacterium]|nr:redoxin domain-containing protein [Alphaproteobacteria bacterium]